MVQLAYTTDYPLAFAGLVADNAPKASITRALEDSVSMQFGRPAVAGTDPEKQFALPSSAGEVFMGITVHHHAQQDLTAASAGIVQDESAELLRQGEIWVIVEEAVVPGDLVFFRHTINGGLVPGGWRTDADTAKADQIVAAQFMTTSLIDTLAKIQINVP